MGALQTRYNASFSALTGYVASTPPPQWDPNTDPNRNQYGAARENYIRQHLRDDGWKIRAESDAQIRNQLGVEGKAADIYATRNGRFLIGESKGMKVGEALQQLRNTVDSLYRTHASAVGNTDVHLYVNQNSWSQLSEGWLRGYRVHNGILQWFDDALGWQNALAGGQPVQVFVIP